MNSIYELLQLGVEAIQLEQEIKELHAKINENRESQKVLYNRIKDYCGYSGKTTKDLLDKLILEAKEVSDNG